MKMTKAKMIELLNKDYDSYLIMEKVCLAAIGEFDDKQFPLRDRLNEITDTKIALLTAIDALEQDNGWISVKDRYPEDDGKYMVWYKGEWDACEFDVCEFDVDSKTFGFTYDDYDEMNSPLVCWDDDMDKYVTHWRPLPEPPKEG